MAQTHASSMIVTSFSVSPYEPCLTDSVGHVLLVPSTPLAPMGVQTYFATLEISVVAPQKFGNQSTSRSNYITLVIKLI